MFKDGNQKMKSNKMYVNGKEEEWTDAQMWEWFEDHCDSLTQVLCSRNSTLRKLSKDYKILQQAHAELQQAYTNEMLKNGELAEELKRTEDE
jgi:1,2-phenylacetyl-CoA epoxidase catalytic subunit